MITISHTHADGTTLDGSRKGDGALEIVRRHGFDWRRVPGIHIRHSRDTFARRHLIDGAADALRAAGHDVTVTVDDTPRATVEREADREQRADARADRCTERAGKAAARSEAAMDGVHRIGDGIPFGQPILVGHHSEGRARRDQARMEAGMRRSVDEADKARELADRAHAAVANVEHRTDPRVTMRRIERLETKGRDIARKLADSTPDSGYHTRMTARTEQIREEVDYWRAQLAGQADAGTFVPWGAEHFRKGDEVNVHDTWYPVVRVNRKSVSVPPLIGLGSRNSMTGEPWSWTDTVPWDKVAGRRRNGEQLDTPNGQPWNVELAAKVARWARLLNSAERRGGHDDASRQKVAYVKKAQRIAHGLGLLAADSEVQAFQPDADDTATRRALAAAYVDIFDRLTAGEKVADIAASLPDMPHIEPTWRMPSGEPQRMQVREVKPGDIVQGVYGTGGLEGTMLGRYFAGPVAAVVGHDGDEYSGERFVGYWHVKLTTGESREFKPWQPLAVFPAAVVEPADAPAAVEAPSVPAAEQVDAAYSAGRAAYREGRPRAAGTDGTVLALVEGMAVGGGAAAVFEAFSRGFDAAADEAAAQVLAEQPAVPVAVPAPEVAPRRSPWADLLAARVAA
jgi:hypothetical protein